MKIGVCVFRKKFIYSNTDTFFSARYKGRIIEVSDVGENEYGGREYYCTVIGEENGIYDVDGHVKRFNIHDAIIWTLNGACLNE